MLREKRRQAASELPSTALSLAVTIATAFLLAHGLADHRIATGGFVALFGGVGTLRGAMHRVAFGVRDQQTGSPMWDTSASSSPCPTRWAAAWRRPFRCPRGRASAFRP